MASDTPIAHRPDSVNMQRSRTRHAARWNALCACGSAPGTTAFVLCGAVVPVSGHGGLPPWPSCTRLRVSSWHPWSAAASAKLHNAAFCKVPASQSQAPFVSGTASRPSGLQNRRYAKLPSLSSRGRGTVAYIRRFALHQAHTRCPLRGQPGQHVPPISKNIPQNIPPLLSGTWHTTADVNELGKHSFIGKTKKAGR